MNYLGFAAIGTLLASAWSYIRMLFSQLRSYFIINMKFEGYMSRAMQLLLWREFTRKHIGDRTYIGKLFYVRPVSRTMVVGFEVMGKTLTVFWQGWRPIFVSSVSIGSGKNDNAEVGQAEALSISFIRYTFDADTLVIRALDLFADNLDEQAGKLRGNRYFVKKCLGTRLQKNYGNNGSHTSPQGEKAIGGIDNVLEAGSRVLKWKIEDIGEPRNPNPFDYVDFPPEILEHIEDITRWKKSEDWFVKKFIPWRRGFLLHGIPGCGKTTLVRALGQLLDMPIYIYDLSTMNNDDLNRMWQDMMNHSPIIALFEDLDGVFHGRKNIQGEDCVTFDCLLNCISGVESSNGVFTIVTTNDISKIDAAMGNFSGVNGSSRPGRLDKIIELKAMTKPCRLRMAKRILEDCPEEIDKVVEMSEGYTPAQVQEKCTEIALKHYWKDK